MQKQLRKQAASLMILSSCLSLPAFAEEAEPGFLIIGPAIAPEYQGSDDYAPVPMIVSQFDWLDQHFEIEGLTLRGSLYQTEHWRFGLTTEFDFGRDADVENPLIAQFEEIDMSVNVGGYIAYEQQDTFFAEDNLAYRLALFGDASNTHGGYYGTAGVAYTFPMVIPWRVELELESTYASADYMDTYFGVSAVDAQRSGLAGYSADASLRDVTLNANIGLFTSPKWGAFLRLGVTQLLGDAKNSPIIEQGSEQQYFAGLGVFYRFGE